MEPSNSVGLTYLHFLDGHLLLGGEVKIEQNAGRGAAVFVAPRVAGFGEGEAQPAGAGGGGQLGFGVGVNQVHAVVAGRGVLGALVEARAVAGGPHRAEGSIHRAGVGFGLVEVFQVAGGGHHAQPAQAKGVQVAEARNAAHRVFVAGRPHLPLVVGAELNHAKRHRRPRKQRPPRVGGTREHVDVIHWLLGCYPCLWPRLGRSQQRQ